MKLKRNDILLLLMLLIVVVLCFAGYRLLHHNRGDFVQVTVDSRVVKTLPLNANTTYTIRTGKDGKNVLEIKNGTAGICQANCPDKLCVHQKKIQKEGETLVCLPHKIVVSITSSKKATLDGVAQ